jgi:hypothetical protein
LFHDFAGRVVVKVGVRERLCGVGDLAEDLGRSGRPEPDEDSGRIGAVEEVVDLAGVGRESAISVAEQCEQLATTGAVSTESVVVQSFDGAALGAGQEGFGVFAVAGGAVRSVGQAGRDVPDTVAAHAAFPLSRTARAERLSFGGA